MFKFRLTSIMRLKEYTEKLCRDEVARCLQLLRGAIDAESELKGKLFSVENEITRCQEGKIDIEEIILRQNYRIYLKKLIIEQQSLVALRQEQLFKAKQKLVEAVKDKKVLEKLKEKKYQQYLYEQERVEQALLDEIANRN